MSQEKDEVRRLLDVLRTLMRMLAFSNREVERRLGLNNSTLTRIFNGQIEAKLEVILGGARAIGLEYDEFFAFVYPERRRPENQSEAARKIYFMLADLQPNRIAPPGDDRPAAEPARPPSPSFAPVNREELLEDLKQAVREILDEKGTGGSGTRAGHGK